MRMKGDPRIQAQRGGGHYRVGDTTVVRVGQLWNVYHGIVETFPTLRCAILAALLVEGTATDDESVEFSNAAA